MIKPSIPLPGANTIVAELVRGQDIATIGSPGEEDGLCRTTGVVR